MQAFIQPLWILATILLVFSMTAVAKDTIEISSSNDFDAPEIEHDPQTDVVRDRQGNILIRAKVYDEFSVNHVLLYFRDSDNKKYRKRPMQANASLGEDMYQASIPKTAISGDRIEYYFEADDNSGNKKLKGLDFSPLERQIADIAIVNTNNVDISKTPRTEKTATVKVEKPAEKPTQPSKPGPEPLDKPMVWMPGF